MMASSSSSLSAAAAASASSSSSRRPSFPFTSDSASASSSSSRRRSKAAMPNKRSLMSRFSSSTTQQASSSGQEDGAEADDSIDAGLWDKNEAAFLQESSPYLSQSGSRPSSTWTSSSGGGGDGFTAVAPTNVVLSPTSPLEELRGSVLVSSPPPPPPPSFSTGAATGATLSPSSLDPYNSRLSMASSSSRKSSSRRLDSSGFSDAGTSLTYPTTISSDSFERPRRAPKIAPATRRSADVATVASMPTQWRATTTAAHTQDSPTIPETVAFGTSPMSEPAGPEVQQAGFMLDGMLLQRDSFDSEAEGAEDDEEGQKAAGSSLQPPTMSRTTFPQTPTMDREEESWLDYRREEGEEGQFVVRGEEDADVTATPASLPRSNAIPPTLADSWADPYECDHHDDDGRWHESHPYRVMEVERFSGGGASPSGSEEERRRKAEWANMMEKSGLVGLSKSPRSKRVDMGTLLKARKSREPLPSYNTSSDAELLKTPPLPATIPASSSSPSLVGGIKKLLKGKKNRGKVTPSPQSSPMALASDTPGKREVVAAVMPGSSSRKGSAGSLSLHGGLGSSSDISSFAMSPAGSRRPSEAASGVGASAGLLSPRRDSQSATMSPSPSATGPYRRAHPPPSSSRALAKMMASATSPPSIGRRGSSTAGQAYSHDASSDPRRPSLISQDGQRDPGTLRRMLSGGSNSSMRSGRRRSRTGSAGGVSVIEHISHEEARRRSGSLQGPVLQYGPGDGTEHLLRPGSRASVATGGSGMQWSNPWDSPARIAAGAGWSPLPHQQQGTFAAASMDHLPRVRRGSAASTASPAVKLPPRRGSSSMAQDARRRLSSILRPSTSASGTERMILPHNISRPVSVVGSAISHGGDRDEDEMAFIRPPSAMSAHRHPQDGGGGALSASNGVYRRPSTASSTMASSRTAGIQRSPIGPPSAAAVSELAWQERRRPSTSDNARGVQVQTGEFGSSPPHEAGPQRPLRPAASPSPSPYDQASSPPAASSASVYSLPTYTKRPTFGLDLQPDAAAAFDSIPSPEVVRNAPAATSVRSAVARLGVGARGGVRSTVVSDSSSSSSRRSHLQEGAGGYHHHLATGLPSPQNSSSAGTTAAPTSASFKTKSFGSSVHRSEGGENDDHAEAGEDGQVTGEEEEEADLTAREASLRRLTLNEAVGLLPPPPALRDGYREELESPRPPLVDTPLSPGLLQDEYEYEHEHEHGGFGGSGGFAAMQDNSLPPALPPKEAIWTVRSDVRGEQQDVEEQQDVVEILV